MTTTPEHIEEVLDDLCPCCGGDGYVFECFDGCCADADVGCDDCTRPCPECTPRTQGERK